MLFLFLCIGHACIFFPVTFYTFLAELKEGAPGHGNFALSGIIFLGSLIITIILIYISLLYVFGKIHLVLNDFKIVVDLYLFGMLIASKKIPLTDDTWILMVSGPSDTNAYIFRKSKKAQIIQFDPVVYNIKIHKADCSEVLFSSGNYSRTLKLFKRITERYPELKSRIDTSSEKQLLSEHRKKINYEKKKVALSLSVFCLFCAMLTGFITLASSNMNCYLAAAVFGVPLSVSVSLFVVFLKLRKKEC